METTSNTATATPAKLRNGSWGARVNGATKAGDTVTITARSGKSWSARVERVVWTDGGVSIVATASERTPSRRRNVSAVECCIGCGGRGNVERELGQCEACYADFDC